MESDRWTKGPFDRITPESILEHYMECRYPEGIYGVTTCLHREDPGELYYESQLVIPFADREELLDNISWYHGSRTLQVLLKQKMAQKLELVDVFVPLSVFINGKQQRPVLDAPNDTISFTPIHPEAVENTLRPESLT